MFFAIEKIKEEKKTKEEKSRNSGDNSDNGEIFYIRSYEILKIWLKKKNALIDQYNQTLPENQKFEQIKYSFKQAEKKKLKKVKQTKKFEINQK